MHGPVVVQFVKAQQAKQTNQYKNTKENLYKTNVVFFFAVALRPTASHGLLILEVSRSHTTTHHSR